MPIFGVGEFFKKTGGAHGITVLGLMFAKDFFQLIGVAGSFRSTGRSLLAPDRGQLTEPTDGARADPVFA